MDLYTLNKDTFRATSVIEGYDSLIWTERYRTPGDFEVSFKIKNPNLGDSSYPEPVGTIGKGHLLGIEDSAECMIVESREISVNSDGSATVNYKGRSFETILENRVARPLDPAGSPGAGRYAQPWALNKKDADTPNNWKFKNWTVARTAKLLIELWTNSDTVKSYPYDSLFIKNFECDIGQLDYQGVLPLRTITIKPGTVYERLVELLEMDDLGIRNIRPTYESDTGTLRTTLYKGQDRTGLVVLSTNAGHFRSAKYLDSITDVTDILWEFSYWNFLWGEKREDLSRNQRVTMLDSSDLKVKTSDPAEDKQDQAESMRSRRDAFLKAHADKTYFQGEVAFNIPYRLGVHYHIGDTIRVQGNFGFDAKMRVEEFVRISDSDGERSFPTLSSLDIIQPSEL